MKKRQQAKAPKSHSPLKLGILGGGQLARMLAIEAHHLGIECHILSESADDPAAQVTPYWHPWNDQRSDLIHFAKRLDLLTFESEFIKADFLAGALNASKSPKLKIFPNLLSLGTFQDRATQKQTLIDFAVPSADFVLIENESDLKMAWQKFKGPFVLKKRRNGYDGNGTFYCRKSSDIRTFDKLVKDQSGGFIAEKWIRFERECALILVRSSNGSIAELPLMESHQVHSRCDWVAGPITHKRLHRTKQNLKKMMNSLDYVGALGVELFDTGDQLLVNELAPRVHNTGHYSQNGLSQNQFSLHLLAGLGSQLENPESLAPAMAMANLIGTGNTHNNWQDSLKTIRSSACAHWYGKFENRPGRKMGHLNSTGKNVKSTLRKLLAARKRIKV